MIIERLLAGPLETNCYLVGCPETHRAAVIDPGGDADVIAAKVGDLVLTVEWIINTHGHGDHMGGNADVKAMFPSARLAIHEADAPYLLRPELNLSHFFGAPVISPAADVLLKDGDEVLIGKLRLRVIHVPGHTPGGIALYADAAESGLGKPVLLCGDALFAGGIGRTDFPGGSEGQLIGAIRERLLTLPPDTLVYPGHGEPTTIGREAATNPFLT